MTSGARWVVVGYGMGAHHARLINEVEGLSVYGVCDVSAAQTERAERDLPGVRTWPDCARMLADPDVDGVSIVTPHSTHAELAVAALDAGKHVITDKAMCLTVREARQMIAARDRSGTLLSTFHNRRWDSDFLTVRQVIADGLIGKPYHIESCVTYHGSPGGWRQDRDQMGGWLYDWGAHTLDQTLQLVGARPERVYAFTHHRRGSTATAEDYIHCSVAFADGTTAVTVIGYLNKLPMSRWYVIGDRGALRADDFERPLQVRTTLGSVEADVSVPLLKGEWRSFYQNVADVLAGRAELAVRPEQLVPQIAVAEAAYRSARSGQAQAVVY